MPNAEEFIAHYGIKGMKWGIINEERDEKINESHGKIYDTVNKVGAALGVDKAKDNVAAKEEKAAADRGIKSAERYFDHFMRVIDNPEWQDTVNNPDFRLKDSKAEEYLWNIRGNMGIDDRSGYDSGDLSSIENMYNAAKSFDLFMNEYAKRNKTSLEDDPLIKQLAADSEKLDDLFNTKYEENGLAAYTDPEYLREIQRAEYNLDQVAGHIADTFGLGHDDETAYRIREDIKVLLFNTGYTNIAGHDNTDWTQYERRDKRREQRKKDKRNDSSIQHSDMSDCIELPYLAHHGIKGQKWGIRRFQNYDGTLIKSAGRKEKKHYEYDSGTKEYKKSEARHLTDEELKKRVNRLTQENNYRDQLKKAQEAGMSKRKKLVNKIFVESAQNAASTVMQTVYTKSATAFLKNNFPALMGEGDKKKKTTSA